MDVEFNFPLAQSLTLILGPWKNNIPEYRRNILLVNALNLCVEKGDMRIKGYLITSRRICLVLLIAETEGLAFSIEAFHRELILQIDQYYEQVSSQNYPWLSFKELHTYRTWNRERLFKSSPLINSLLVPLLTGEQVNLPYYNPHLAKMKDLVQNHPFCSAQDYAGGIGPVLLNLQVN